MKIALLKQNIDYGSKFFLNKKKNKFVKILRID